METLGYSKYTFLWINLNKNPERKNRLENIFKNKHINNIRIEGIDGANKDWINDKNITFKNLTDAEIGCTCSHLKAIKFFYDELPDDKICIICEDDISFGYEKYWNYSFDEYIEMAPKFDILQLGITVRHMHHLPEKTYGIHTKNYLSTMCYAITKKHAEHLMDFINNIWIDNGFYFSDSYITKYDKWFVADFFLYKSGIIYSIPLMTHSDKFVSTIHNDHKNIHKKSKKKIKKYWEKKNCILNT